MTITARQLMRTLATLAIAASTVSGVFQSAADAAYACHVDCGHALLHGQRAAVHTPRSHTRGQFPAHLRCAPCEWSQTAVFSPEDPSPEHPGR